jgi:hypothetical protein
MSASAFSFFRATALRALGFDGFFTESLDDSKDLFAFLLPKSYFESYKHHDLITYLLAVFEQCGWKTLETSVLETGTYETNWCGSRHNTHILGPHILFHMQYSAPNPDPRTYDLSRPELPWNWTIIEVDYDSLKPSGSFIRFSTYLYEAAIPEDFINVHNRLKQTALAEIHRFMC